MDDTSEGREDESRDAAVELVTEEELDGWDLESEITWGLDDEAAD